jgi:hypothetical protein
MPHTPAGYFEPDNGDRAEWANVALDAYAAQTRNNPQEQSVSVDNPDDPDEKENAEEVIGDLLSDLHHLCDQWGIDWEGRLETAAMHYRDEVAEAQQ